MIFRGGGVKHGGDNHLGPANRSLAEEVLTIRRYSSPSVAMSKTYPRVGW